MSDLSFGVITAIEYQSYSAQSIRKSQTLRCYANV